MSKSCRTCPSFVASLDAATVYVKSPNADSCARHGRILSRPDQLDAVNERICETFGSSCADHGESRPSLITKVLVAEVAVGDPVAIRRRGTLTEQPASCVECEHLVPAEVVQRELGWTLPLCASQGRLIFPNRVVQEAGDCGVGLRGINRDTTDGVRLMPEYDLGPGSVIGLVLQPRDFVITEEMERHAVDPRAYVTDKPVTDDDAAECIRAWRQINDPEGLHDPVFMPIFDGEKLCGFDPRSSYGSHRPDLYIDHQGVLYDAVVEMFKFNMTPLLIGSAGTGKTEFGCFLAYLMDLPFTRLSVSKGTEDYHFAGEKVLETDPITGTPITVWKPGRFTEKYDKPGVIIVDEPNMKADIYAFLRPAFDSAKQLVLDAAQGLTVTRGRHTYLLAAQNPEWDPTNVGTEPMAAADIDRVCPIWFGLPEDHVERAIIRKHCADGGYEIDNATLDKLMSVAGTLRTMIADGALPIAWGLRAQLKVARMTQYFSFEKSYRRALLDGMEPGTVDVVLGAVRSVSL